jgi:hypothetical protein
MTLTLKEAMEADARQRSRERAAIRDFVEAARPPGDAGKFRSALEVLANGGGDALRSAFRRVAREPKIAPAIRRGFLETWVQHGESWRTEVNDDLVLTGALWALFPPYRGPAVVLYRGDTALNRKRRLYGACWSRLRTIAEQHAQHKRHGPQGSVLLKTLAPREAIICALPDHTESVEAEYLVDRRRLGRVTVEARFAANQGGKVGVLLT